MESSLSFIAPILVAASCIAYVFWTQSKIARPERHSLLAHLQERKAVIYDNLRDLNFEYRAGKYPADDYESQRKQLEDEAAALVAEERRLIELQNSRLGTPSSK